MATLTASHFVSHLNGANSVDYQTNLPQIGLRSQSVTHNGFRSVKHFSGLRLKNNAKRNLSVKNSSTENARPSDEIVCEPGMTMVFVSAECGPWSKTGGLGDVLGGLPPAMAVSILLIT